MHDPSKCDYECYKMCEIGEYLYIKNYACKEHVIDNLMVTYENETLNTTKTTIVDKKITYENNNCLMCNFSFTHLLLVIVFLQQKVLLIKIKMYYHISI